MYCLIELIPKKNIIYDVEPLLWQLLCSLMRSGQILNEYTIIKNGNYFLSVTLPHEDSFDEKYDDTYVRRDRDQIKRSFDFKVIPMGENINSTSYCTCTNRPAIEMETHGNDIDSPFICCGCGHPIAKYKLSTDKDNVNFDLQCWQDSFSAMDKLWMRCLCDRYSGNQLFKTNSILNSQGIALTKKLEEKLGTKVYYHMYDDGYSKRVKTAMIGDRVCRICPGCGEVMEYKVFSEDFELDICNNCGLSSDCL